jgi:hypothetical protein
MKTPQRTQAINFFKGVVIALLAFAGIGFNAAAAPELK